MSMWRCSGPCGRGRSSSTKWWSPRATTSIRSATPCRARRSSPTPGSSSTWPGRRTSPAAWESGSRYARGVPVSGHLLFPEGDHGGGIAKRMVQRYKGAFADSYRTRAGELGFTEHQIITLASIVEKGGEASGGAEAHRRGIPQPSEAGHETPGRPHGCLRHKGVGHERNAQRSQTQITL